MIAIVVDDVVVLIIISLAVACSPTPTLHRGRIHTNLLWPDSTVLGCLLQMRGTCALSFLSDSI
jgi:hypothetical protein